MTRLQETTQHYTPHATLAALGLKIRSLKLFDTIKEHVYQAEDRPPYARREASGCLHRHPRRRARPL